MKLLLRLFVALAGAIGSLAHAETPAERRSGFDFMSRETQQMQSEDFLNPGMLWVAEGEALWSRRAGAANRSCADCHGDAATTFRGVAARYPAFDERDKRPIDLQQRINRCRQDNQQAEPLAPESRDLLSLTAFIGHQSRGMPITPPDDARLAVFRDRGRAFFHRRIGQLNFSCAQCHDDGWSERLGSSLITQAHPTGYPIYRLEWQGMGSLQRRFRNCMIGVRAEPLPFGAPEFVELELYLATRAAGMPVETPAVRP